MIPQGGIGEGVRKGRGEGIEMARRGRNNGALIFLNGGRFRESVFC